MSSVNGIAETPYTRGEQLIGGCIALLLWMLSASMLIGLTLWATGSRGV